MEQNFNQYFLRAKQRTISKRVSIKIQMDSNSDTNKGKTIQNLKLQNKNKNYQIVRAVLSSICWCRSSNLYLRSSLLRIVAELVQKMEEKQGEGDDRDEKSRIEMGKN